MTSPSSAPPIVAGRALSGSGNGILDDDTRASLAVRLYTKCTYFNVRTVVGPSANSLGLNALRDRSAGRRRTICSSPQPRQSATEPALSLESQSYRPNRLRARAPHPPPQESRLHTQRP